jgi:hypothetical protein
MDASVHKPSLAVIGAGVAGLSAAWLLRHDFAVTLYEAEPRAGGHADTQLVQLGGRDVAVDTGFIVCNDATYPNLLALFAHLGIALHATDMSFGVSVAGGRLEYAGGELAQLFAQKRNLFRPRFWAMVRDILRFYREAPALLHATGEESLGAYLDRNGYGQAFCEDHILPMGAAIWSASVEGMRAFPARHFIRFFANHGLLQVTNRPRWRTVQGGSREYVRRLLADLADVRLARPVRALSRGADGVRLTADDGTARFDHVILACHADEALRLLTDATQAERDVLGAIRFQDNLAVLHTDAALMPRRKAAWSAWNYLTAGPADHGAAVSVTYWMNRLQGLTTPEPLLVSLNPIRPPAPSRVLLTRAYRHPQFDAAAMRAQERLPALQGHGGVWFAGAWTGWGFHEDGIASAVRVAERLGVAAPWATRDSRVPA